MERECHHSAQTKPNTIPVAQLTLSDRCSINEGRLLGGQVNECDSLQLIYFEGSVNLGDHVLGENYLTLRRISPHHHAALVDKQLTTGELADEALS